MEPLLANETLQFEGLHWYAVQTRARHEKRVGAELEKCGIQSFVPTKRETHRWSDRKKIVEVPLFSCYVFVKIAVNPTQQLEVLKTPGVFRFVCVNSEPASIPDSEIEGIQTVLANKLPVTSTGLVRVGERVRIRGGVLDGIEGTLIQARGEHKLVLSVRLIHQSIELRLDGYDVERIGSAAKGAH